LLQRIKGLGEDIGIGPLASDPSQLQVRMNTKGGCGAGTSENGGNTFNIGDCGGAGLQQLPGS
jgi:hypothetical protein